MKPLVIFEIANNHMGELNHGKKIIKTYYNISKKYRNIIDLAVKFQFRDLETFINPKFKNINHNQVKRFVDTKLSSKEWSDLITFSKKRFKIIYILSQNKKKWNGIKNRLNKKKIEKILEVIRK